MPSGVNDPAESHNVVSPTTAPHPMSYKKVLMHVVMVHGASLHFIASPCDKHKSAGLSNTVF